MRLQDSKMQLDNPSETMEQVKNGEIDESLYSRQLYAVPFLPHSTTLIKG